LGNVFQRALDAAGFVSAITNATGQAVLFERDSRHQVIATEDSLGRVREFAYDARGILTNATLPVIGAAGYAPDELGQLQTLTDQNGQQWGFDYTSLGRRLTMVDPLNRTKSVSYDASGRARRLAFADGASATNTFDGAGNITRRDFSDGLVANYGYDPLNRLTNTTALAARPSTPPT
jgi:YD repeat-containing protein